MVIKELFDKFEVMPQLVEHQLRVGAVGQILAQNWIYPIRPTSSGGAKVDVELTTKLCLLHDMGNIVKFDLSDEAQREAQFGKTGNLPYWRKVQAKYRDKYGRDAHAATKGVLAEAGLSELIHYIDEEAELYFSEAGPKELATTNPATVILMYADMRVKPEGVVSYQERVDDLQKRYGGGRTATWYEWTKTFAKFIKEQTRIDPESITEEVVRARWNELLSVRI